ncbi:MAG TPA: hypothetical protein VEA69_24345 [Tepidisphaeraceae bacterium]|nr:hypothetical protein [Tepidisphaeraceae bacterium]
MTTDDLPPRRSLFRDLADGSAGWGTRVMVAIALAVFLIGVALMAAYALAAMVPRWNRYFYYGPVTPRGGGVPARGVAPDDGLMVVCVVAAIVLWLIAVGWLFFRSVRTGVMLRPILITVGIAMVATVLGVWADTLRGEQELVIGGIVMLGISATLLVWVQVARNARLGRPMRHHVDKQVDVRCPDCGYRMVGLFDTRCPECGKQYSLDELLARQGFERPPGAVPPPIPAAAGAH